MDFDELFEAAPVGPGDSRKRADITGSQFRALAAPKLPCGYYTLTLTDGSRKGFRVRLERGSYITGQRTLAQYCKIAADDDVKREWETIAVVGPDGFNVFKRWRNDWQARWAAAIWALAHGREAAGYSLQIEPRCWLCMRELKTPEQVQDGLTPGCRKKLFGA